MYLYPVVELDLKNIENINELELDEKLDYDPYFTLFYYVFCWFIVTCATKGLQLTIRRQLPPLPKESSDGTAAPNQRTFNVRDDDEYSSMPAGSSV